MYIKGCLGMASIVEKIRVNRYIFRRKKAEALKWIGKENECRKKDWKRKNELKGKCYNDWYTMGGCKWRGCGK